METSTPTSEEKRPGFSATNPQYAQALSAESGRVLDELASVYEKLAGEGVAAFASPIFELRVDMPWDFTPRPDFPAGRVAYGKKGAKTGPEDPTSGVAWLPPLDFTGTPAFDSPDNLERDREHIRRLIVEGRAQGVIRWAALTTASHLTIELRGSRPEWERLPVEVDSHGRRYALRHDLREWLDRNLPTPESMAALVPGSGPWIVDPTLRLRAVDAITAGFLVGFGHAPPADFPVAWGEPLIELLDAELPDLPKPLFKVGEKKALALVQFAPCVLDGEASRATFPIIATVLVFDDDPAADGEGRPPTLEEAPVVVAALRDLARLYRPPEESIFEETAEEKTFPEIRRAKGPSLLLDVRSRMDPETVKLTSFAVDGALPRRWRKARRWEDAEGERVSEFLRQHGEAAFEKTPSRPALLTRRRGGDPALALQERNRLEAELGSRGGFVRADPEGGEWLVRALRVGAGFVTVGISWYQSAEKLISERREEWATSLRSRLAEGKESGQRRLAFAELSDDEKAKVERVLEHLGTLEDARRILDLVLRRAFATGAKIVDFPAHELRILLECDGPGDRGNERIRRALAALEHLAFKVVHKAIKGTPSAKFQGRFVAAHYYFAAGEGARSDGIFVVELASPVPGVASLLVEAGRGRSTLGRAAASAALDSSAKPAATTKSLELLAGEDAPRLRQRRKKGDRPAKALSTVGPYRKRAVCDSIHEERAFDFLEGNLTTSLAPDRLGRRKRERKLAGSVEGLRIYSREWCPLLGEGEWVAALGTHRRSPESGWTLAGRGSFATKTGGGRPAGLVDHVGRPYPSGSAHAERRDSALATLEDFEAVLSKLGGVIVGVRRRKGEARRPAEWDWISLKTARELSTKELVDVRWFPFLPADWTRRADELVERRQAERVERGEGERPVFVTRNPGDYLASVERDGISWRHRPGETEELETWPADGRERPAPEVRPLGDRLAEKIEASGLRKGEVAKAFGVSPASLTRWLRPLAERDEHKGSGVPAALAGLVERWVETGTLPTAEELEAVSSRRGKPRE
jgi:very-short-patch-repair endonuclease